MHQRTVIGLIIGSVLVSLLIVNQLFTQYWLDQKKLDAETINLGGKQRMLSQRISLKFYESKSNDKSLIEAKDLFYEWEEIHYALVNGNEKLAIDSIAIPEAHEELKQLTPLVVFLKSKIESTEPLTPEEIDSISMNQTRFLIGMNSVVDIIGEIAEHKLDNLIVFQKMFTLITVIIGFILIMVGFKYIYKPIETDLRNSLKRAQESETILRAIYDSSIDASELMDKDYKLLYRNKKSQEFTRRVYDKSLEIGDSALALYDLKDRETMRDKYEKVFNGDFINYELPHGDKLWRINLFPVYNKEGKIIGITKNVRDITENRKLVDDHKELSKRLDLIAANFPNGSISLFDLDEKLLYTNGSFYKTSKIRPADVIGLTLDKILKKEHYVQFKTFFPKVKNGETVEFQTSGSGYTFLNIIQPIHSADGSIKEFIFISTNITSLIENQKIILAQSDKLRDIAWIQAHELRGPLTSLMGIINLIILEKNEVIGEDYVEFLKAAALNLDQVTRKIIETSTVENKKAP